MGSVLFQTKDFLSSQGGATFSPCMKYRYALWRCNLQGEDLFSQKTNKGSVAMVGLNPSTADHKINDPTLRRNIAFATAWGYTRMVMLNSFGYRSTDPRALLDLDDPIGPANDTVIEQHVREANLVVVCWGANMESHEARKTQILSLLRGICSDRVMCFGLTRHGHPKHPLYLRADSALVPMEV